jgi:hypothetical protein
VPGLVASDLKSRFEILAFVQVEFIAHQALFQACYIKHWVDIRFLGTNRIPITFIVSTNAQLT